MPLVLAVLLVLALPAAVHAGAGAGLSREPVVYVIDGYLDQAPPGMVAVERVTLGARGRSRHWLLAAYRRDGDRGDPWLLTDNLGAYHPDFLLIGEATDVARILDAPPGTRIRGRFQYLPAIHSLLIDRHGLAVEPPRETRPSAPRGLRLIPRSDAR